MAVIWQTEDAQPEPGPAPEPTPEPPRRATPYRGDYCSRCGGPRPAGWLMPVCPDVLCLGVMITAGEHEDNVVPVTPLPPEGCWTGEERKRRAEANGRGPTT